MKYLFSLNKVRISSLDILGIRERPPLLLEPLLEELLLIEPELELLTLLELFINEEEDLSLPFYSFYLNLYKR